MTADPKLDGMRPDQLAALCLCSDVVVVTLNGTLGVGMGGPQDGVKFGGKCDTCGRWIEVHAQARRTKKVAAGDP